MIIRSHLESAQCRERNQIYSLDHMREVTLHEGSAFPYVIPIKETILSNDHEMKQLARMHLNFVGNHHFFYLSTTIPNKWYYVQGYNKVRVEFTLEAISS